MTIYKSDLSDKIKWDFFQIVAMQYNCVAAPTGLKQKAWWKGWMGTTQAILNKSWKQHPTKLQLFSYLPLVLQTVQVRLGRHAGEVGTKS